MAIDVKEKVSEFVEKVKADPSLLSKFKNDPVKTIEAFLGVDLPDEITNQVVNGAMEKLGIKADDAKKDDDKDDSISDKLGGIVDSLKGILNK